MGWRMLLLLLLLVGGLAAYLVFKGKQQQDPLPTATERALAGYQFREAHEIVIWPKPKDQTEAIKIVRKQGGYWVREPLRDKASFALIRNLEGIFDSAVLLEGHDAETLKKEPQRVEQCGLSKPARTIEFHFKTADGADDTITLEMGGITPFGSGIFVRRGDTIYRCPNRAPLSALNIQPDDTRERTLVDPWVMSTLQASQVRHQLPDGTFAELELTKRAMSEFWITKPGNMRADQRVVGNYLGVLAGLHVRTFLSGGVNLEIGPDQEPVFHIILRSERGTEEIKIFKTLASPQKYWGHHSRRDIAFTIDLKDGIAALEAKANLLRARMLLPIKREDIVRIVLDPGGDEPKADLKFGMGQTLRMHAPVISRLEPTRLSKLLRGLTTMQVQEFMDDANPEDFGLGAGAFRVTVQENRTRKTITLRLGKDEGEQLTYVTREDDAYVAKVLKTNADKVRQRWVDLLSLQVTSLKLPVFRLEVHRDGKRRFVYQRLDGEWRAEGAEQEDAEVAELVEDHLKMLRARKALTAPEDLGAPMVLKLIREPDGADVLLELRAWLRDGQVLVAGELRGVVYQLNNRLLKVLLQRWSE
jgi:hypothetical protein